jgi:hypothetical protein
MPMKAVAMHVGYWECGDVVQDQVMTTRAQSQTSSGPTGPNQTHTKNLYQRHELQARSMDHIVLLARLVVAVWSWCC